MGLHASWTAGRDICRVQLVLYRNPHGRVDAETRVTRPACITMGMVPNLPIAGHYLALSSGRRNK